MSRKYFSLLGIIIELLFCGGQLNLRNLSTGDLCFIESTDKSGECKLLQDCPSIASSWKYLDDQNRPTICGFEDTKPIVCCPSSNLTSSRIDNSEYLKFNQTCVDSQTNEIGIILKIKDCLHPSELLDKNIVISKVCPYDICNDLMCCTQCQTDLNCAHRNIKNVLRNRLENNFECRVVDTNEPGIYINSKSCSYYDNEFKNNNIPLPKVCEWDFCEDVICCPKTHINKADCKEIKYYLDEVQLHAGPCTTHLNSTGICTSMHQCSSDIRKTKKFLECGQHCDETLICCPGSEKIGKSGEACGSYRSLIYKDIKFIEPLLKKIFTRSVVNLTMDFSLDPPPPETAGGILAKREEYPHMVALGYDVNDQIEWNCGGTLITDEYILTAAHCFYLSKTSPVKYTKIGVIDLTETECTCSNNFEIIEKAHPNYIKKVSYNDIGLLKLDRKVLFSQNIRPACLPTTPDIPHYLKAVGFGETNVGGSKSNELMQVHLEYFSHYECNESFKFNFNRRFSGINDDTQFCAGSRFTIMDTCRGDSGGPIEADHPEYDKLKIIYGVTSFGRACGFIGAPAVYTNIFSY